MLDNGQANGKGTMTKLMKFLTTGMYSRPKTPVRVQVAVEGPSRQNGHAHRWVRNGGQSCPST